MKKLLLMLPAIALLAAGCNNIQPTIQTNTPATNEQVQTETQSNPNIPESSTSSKSQTYENQYMKLTIPAGWTAKQANKTIYYGDCAVYKDNCTTTPKVEPNPSAVNITKGNYILYINTQASQASGVEGGRFGEIASGAPSADGVVTEWPNPPCGTSESHTAFADRTRGDLYVSNKEKNNYCAVPKNGSTVWYFSYITGPGDGYFNYYKTGQGLGYVITMAYNSKDVNKLPVVGSAPLKTALDEMTAILQTLVIKEK